ncbi:DUF7282 domain-containing protein [Halopiger djelfimassiliensis]|uniref:DUF7282 domain-containing protein n=1 Tax=Halopiger djelfimassiliensis TaxID=1293047 RepID=UPI000677CEAD|nr:hypothetical protein [Halopiger djelfimassiliensis]
MRKTGSAVVLVAVAAITSVVALPLLAGVSGSAVRDGTTGVVEGPPAEAETTPMTPDARDAGTNGTQEHETAVDDGVDEGIALVETQGIEVTQQQRAAAIDGAGEAVTQHLQADAQQVQAATAGAVHGALVQEQRVNATQIQHAVAGAIDGALDHRGTASASQLQSAAWGGTHGALAQAHRATVDRIRAAARGGASGAASEAGTTDDATPLVREAAQGSAYGVLEQYQRLTVEQRQRVTLSHLFHAAAGAGAGALEGSVSAVERQQRVTAEQSQRVTMKEVQEAASGAAKGALVQRQAATVEQTQAVARGAGMGSLQSIRTIRLEQRQRITIDRIHAASFGAATGSIAAAETATVEQLQAAADGAAGGVLAQQQAVSVTQIQYAAAGAAKGVVESTVQQGLEVEHVRAAAAGAGEGAVVQQQVVDAVQIQTLAGGSAAGVLSQSRRVTATQTRSAAAVTSRETARAVQRQRLTVTQLRTLAESTAADAASYAGREGIDDGAELVQHVEIELVQRLEDVDEREGTATITVSEQTSAGDSVVVDEITLSEGGFVAVYEGIAVDVDPDGIRGVSPYLEPGNHEFLEIELEEPLEESQPIVAAVHHDTTDDETFRYAATDGAADEPYVTASGSPALDGAFVTVEDRPDEPEATLAVSDQAGSGASLTVDEAIASVEYAVVVTDEDGQELGRTDPIAANESLENASIGLEPALEDGATLEVTVVAAADGESLATETVDYDLDETVDDLFVEYADCTRVEIEGTLEEGTTLYPRTLWYDSAGPGDAFYSGVTAGEEVDAPFTGTVVMAVGEAFDIRQVDAETVVIEVPDEGRFGSFIVPWINQPAEAESTLATPPAALECGDAIQPARPTTTVETVEEIADGFAVTFGYENPNDAALPGGEFVAGTTADQPVEELEPGDGEFTVEWTPETDDERLVWAVPMADFGYDDPVRAETDPAGEYDRSEAFAVEFVDCSRAEVTGSFEDGDTIIVATGFYESGGFGNTMGEYAITVGEDVDAPLEGTIVFETGTAFTVSETDEGAIVEVPEGAFGAAITGIVSPDATPGEIDHPNPDAGRCIAEVRPELPAITVEETTSTADAIEVTFGYENPNDAALLVGSEFIEGTTADEPITELEPGDGEFTVEWTPETDDERLVWAVDMDNYDYEEVLTAATDPAGEITPTEPAAFAVSIADTNDPVERGVPLEVDAAIENVGDEAGTQVIELAVDGVVVDSASVSLEPGATESVPLTGETDGLEPGEYGLEVSSGNETVATAVTIEGIADPEQPEPEPPTSPEPPAPADPEPPVTPAPEPPAAPDGPAASAVPDSPAASDAPEPAAEGNETDGTAETDE